MPLNQKGFAPVLLLVAALGVIAFIIFAGYAPFKDNLYNVLYRKNDSQAASPISNNPFDQAKSVTIYTKEFEERIPADPSLPITGFKSGWEKPEFVSFTKNKIDQARKIGFNTVWLVFPWQRRLNSTTLLNDPALNNLKDVISYTQTKNMQVILPLVYCSAGWCWGGGGSSYLLSTDPTLWQSYQDYTKALVQSLNSHPNVNYLLFSENMVPQVAVLRDPNYPQYNKSFSDFWKNQNGDLSFMNYRWGTAYKTWDEVLPPPADLTGANQYYIQDYYQWSANVVKNTLGKLAPELKKLANSQTKIGYHDYLWDKAGILGNETGIPQPNPYDFLSVGMYPDWTNIQSYTSEPDKYMALLDIYKAKHPASPIFIGELGADSNTYPPENGQYIKQSYYINQILSKAKDKIFGFNLWELIEYNDPENNSEGKFGLMKLDGTYKQPTVATLRANSLSPFIITSTLDISTSPWKVKLTGNNFNKDLIYVVRDGNKPENPIWLDYRRLNFNQDGSAYFRLPYNTLPSKCNQNKNCEILILLYDPLSDITSNSNLLILPAIYPFKGALTPQSVSPGQSFQLSCDYGVNTNSIFPIPGPASTNCSYLGQTGTAVNFSCKASLTPGGPHPVSCSINKIAPDFYETQVNQAGTITIK